MKPLKQSHTKKAKRKRENMERQICVRVAGEGRRKGENWRRYCHTQRRCGEGVRKLVSHGNFCPSSRLSHRRTRLRGNTQITTACKGASQVCEAHGQSSFDV